MRAYVVNWIRPCGGEQLISRVFGGRTGICQVRSRWPVWSVGWVELVQPTREYACYMQVELLPPNRADRADPHRRRVLSVSRWPLARGEAEQQGQAEQGDGGVEMAKKRHGDGGAGPGGAGAPGRGGSHGLGRKMAELRQVGDGGAGRWRTSGAGEHGLGRAAARAGDLGLGRVAAPGGVLGDGGPVACALEQMGEEDDVPKKIKR